MEATESFLPNPGCAKSTTNVSGYFEYSEQSFPYKPGKAFEQNNNNNNNELEVKTEHDASYGIESSIFWSDKDKMDPGGLLGGMDPWGEWSEPKADSNTDGTVYTLTVLNSNEWKCKKPPDNIDIDSFLNIIPETDTSDSSSYYYPEFPAGEMVNNNDWKTNNMNDSLLRNALQGKRNHYKQQSPPTNQLVGHPYNGDEPSNNIDEILGLTMIDSFDDFEKIKKIASEVADCAKFSLSEIPPTSSSYAMPVDSLLLDTRPSSSGTGVKCGKKYSKKSLSNMNVKSGSGGNRKERSLHYCSICSKGFKDKYSVNVHVRTHTGEKPFTCTLCGKSFRQKAHLAKHYQTHLAQTQKHLGNGSSSKARPAKMLDINR